MKSEDALLTAWGKTLARKGDLPAVFDTGGEVLRTFSQIEKRSQEIIPLLGGRGPGEVVAVQLGNHEDWPAWLIAIVRSELVALPLEPQMGEQERANAFRISNAALVAVPKAIGAKHLEVVPLPAAFPSATWGEDRPILLKLTSGTTAEPRMIRFRSKQLLADCHNICETMGITEADINFAVIPVSHSYGFSNLITPLIARGVPMVLSSDPLPRAILHDLERSGATVFPGMPVFYQAFCELREVPILNRLRLCISAGAPLSLEVAQKFRKKFQRPIHSFYGSSECGGICYDREGAGLDAGFVGSPMDGVSLEFLETQTGPGRVRVRSEAVADGYFPVPNEEKLGHGFFVPDDLLQESGEGFRIVGRTSDVINVAGKKVNPAEVEAVLLRHEGVRQAVVFGRESASRNQEVAACVVALRAVKESELLEFCRHRLSGWQVPKQIFLVAEIPVTERGKISRRDLARRFAL
jgi:long-chain acyl-CoA synthetase